MNPASFEEIMNNKNLNWECGQFSSIDRFDGNIYLAIGTSQVVI